MSNSFPTIFHRVDFGWRWVLLALLTMQMPLAAAETHYVDLRTVMKLAGANHDEIELARVRHTQAIAESKRAWQRGAH